MVAQLQGICNQAVAYYTCGVRIERRITLPVGSADAWAGILDFSSWFCDEHALDRVEAGARVEFRWADGVSRAAVFEDVEPPHTLSFRWLPFARDDSGRASPRPQARVEITLEPNGDGVDVIVIERRLDRAEAIA
jgi:uncharacterized protein YndB with AHSA1/START domain